MPLFDRKESNWREVVHYKMLNIVLKYVFVLYEYLFNPKYVNYHITYNLEKIICLLFNWTLFTKECTNFT